jgi:hypothetical protein
LLSAIKAAIADVKITYAEGNDVDGAVDRLLPEIRTLTLTAADKIAIAALNETAKAQWERFASLGLSGAPNVYPDTDSVGTNFTQSVQYRYISRDTLEPLLEDLTAATKNTRSTRDAANDPVYLTILTDSLNAIKTSLTSIGTSLGTEGTLATKLTNLNAKLDAKGNLQAALNAISTNTGDTGTLSKNTGEIIDILGANAKKTVVQYLDEINGGLGTMKNDTLKISNAADPSKNHLNAIKTNTADLNTRLGDIKTASDATTQAVTTSSTTTVTALDGMANKFGLLGTAITGAFSSLGTALSTGLTSIGTAVGAKLSDQADQIKKAQDALTTANAKLQEAQSTTAPITSGGAGSSTSGAGNGSASGSAPSGTATGAGTGNVPAANASASAPGPTPVTYNPPKIDISAPPPTVLNTSASNPVVTATANDQKLVGSNASGETANVPPGITGLSVSQNIEQIQLNNVLSAYKLAQAGNTLKITSENSDNTVATWAIPRSGGTLIASNTARRIQLNGTAMTMGGLSGDTDDTFMLTSTPKVYRAAGGPVGPAYGGGLTVVGEEGPELVRFNIPAQVYSNGQSRSLLQTAGDNQSQAIIGKLEQLIEMQAATIATLQLQSRNQTAEMADLRKEIARQGGIARRAA